ncbi:MAG: tyrosine-type recombinase/integrase, partial [Tepidisphaeraceae bacterium]
DRTPKAEANNIRLAIKPFLEIFGHTEAAKFSPLKLEAFQDLVAKRGDWCRNHINHQMSRIKAMFKWAVRRELILETVYRALLTVPGLQLGATDARESDPVSPVSDQVIDATLPHCSPTIRAMIQVQRWTGARPGEICSMRIGQIDRSRPTWTYSPPHHKTLHHGHARKIFIGQRSQDALAPFLMRLDPLAFVFSPAEAELQRRAALHEKRQTPASHGNRPGSNVKAQPRRRPGNRYTVATYRRAIARACAVAFQPAPPLARRDGESVRAWKQRLTPAERQELKAFNRQHRWHPHQLRHTAATEIRRQFGIEAAQHVLGHAQINMTELYAEKNAEIAEGIARAIG